MLSLIRLSTFVMLSACVIVLLTGCQHTQVEPEPKARPKPSLNKEAAMLNVNLGISYLEKGNAQRAQQKLQLAVQQAPKDPTVLNALAYFYGKTGQPREAEQYYKKALQEDPKGGRGNNNYGVFLCQNQQYEKAIQHFLKATQDPNYLDAGEAFENAGTCAQKIPDTARAQTYYKQAILRDRHRANAFMALARQAIVEKDYVLAKQYLEQYTQYNPDTIESLQLQIDVAEATHANEALTLLKMKFNTLQSPVTSSTKGNAHV